MDPYWNIESVMNPPKLWSTIRNGKGEKAGQPIGHKPLPATDLTNTAPSSKEDNSKGYANGVKSSNDLTGQKSTRKPTIRFEDILGNSLAGPHSSKKNCEGTTNKRPTARKTPHKHKHTKAEIREARRKEREAKKLAKKAKEAMRAEKRMVKRQQRPRKEEACEPCRMH